MSVGSDEAATADRGVAVVSGAARGIGRAIALVLAERGYAIAALDVDGEGTAALVEELEARGAAARGYLVDLSQTGAIVETAAEVAEWGSVRALVNNAGILSTAGLDELTVDEWDAVMAVNLRSAVFLSKELLPRIAANGGGRVVSISSISGRMGGHRTGVAYVASKAALIGITMRFAKEYASQGVTVNAIAPGPAETEMVKLYTPEAYRALVDAVPVGSLIDPESIAETVGFLCTDAARYITGAVIDVNGGMWMGG